MAEEKRAGKEIDEGDQYCHNLYTELIGEETRATESLDWDQILQGAFEQSYGPNPHEPLVNESSSSTVSLSVASSSSFTIDVPSKKQASYASVVDPSSSSTIQEPRKKTQPSSSSTVSSLVVSSSSSRNIAHGTQNSMNQEQISRARSSTLSPTARPWYLHNTTTQRPMQTQMNLTRPASVEQLSGMQQLNLNASTQRMYQQQNQMAIVPSQASMMQHYPFMGPVQPYQPNPYYLPLTPSEPFAFQQNYYQQHQQMQQQPPQSQGSKNGPSSHQGQDKNQQ